MLLETNVFIYWNLLQEDMKAFFFKSWTQAMVLHQHPGLIEAGAKHLTSWENTLLSCFEVVKVSSTSLQLSLNPIDTAPIFGLVLYFYLCPASKLITRLLANTVNFFIPFPGQFSQYLDCLLQNSQFHMDTKCSWFFLTLASFRSSGWLCQECLPVTSTTIRILVKCSSKGCTWNQEWEE